MMKEWQTARKHVNNLKRTNPKAADKLNKNILQVSGHFHLNYCFDIYKCQIAQGKRQTIKKVDIVNVDNLEELNQQNG